jgi:hypothetical protein
MFKSMETEKTRRNLGIRAFETRAKHLRMEAAKRDVSIQRLVDNAIDLYLVLNSEHGVKCPNCAAALRMDSSDGKPEVSVLSVPDSVQDRARKGKELVLVDSDHEQWHVDLEKASTVQKPLLREIFIRTIETIGILAKG